VAHRIAGFLGVVTRLKLRTESTVSATGTLLFSDDMGRYVPNWVGRIKLISITVSSPI
jgi:hypothetical protein